MIETGNISAEQRPLHVLNRLGFGPRPEDLETVKRIGVERWMDQQLAPESIPESPEVEQRIGSLRTLHMTPVELFVQYELPVRRAAKDDKKATRQQSRIIVEEAVQARIARSIESPRQLQEVMSAFWFNHFNVFVGKGLCHLWTGAYEEEAIRPHTLGRFRDLLGATAKHPAMLFYLDNWQNTAPDAPGRRDKFQGINENYARELMELHTLGVNGGYTQTDVIALAHILTGWGIVRGGNGMQQRAQFGGGMFQPRGFGFGPYFGFRPWRQRREAAAMPGGVRTPYGFFFDPSRHDSSDQTIMGRRIGDGGIQAGEEALDMLARHPATANHLSYQLAQYFVADNPPPALVNRMSQRYLSSDGNIRHVLETMFASSEFWDRRNYGAKFKTPYEYVISAVRATGAPVLNVRPLAGTMGLLGMPLYGCQTPDGYKNTQEAWLNPDAMMTRLSFATALGAGRLPLQRPLFEFAQGEGRMAEVGATRPAGFLSPPAAIDDRMEPPDAAGLAMTLGDLFLAADRLRGRSGAHAIARAPYPRQPRVHDALKGVHSMQVRVMQIPLARKLMALVPREARRYSRGFLLSARQYADPAPVRNEILRLVAAERSRQMELPDQMAGAAPALQG